MSAAAAKPKRKRRLRGAAGLWVAVAVLGLAYLAVWSVDRTPGSVPQKPGSIGGISVPTLPSLPAQSQNDLAAKATADATSRAPGAQIKVVQVQPALLVPGPELRQSSGGAGQPGLVITVGVIRDGKLTERLTYHALPPDQVVFIEQRPAG